MIDAIDLNGQLHQLAARIDDMLTELARAREQLRLKDDRLSALLRNVGVQGRCSGPNCGAAILWIVHASGRRTPYDPDGVIHFGTCPDRKQFKTRSIHE